jgi:hypothetical protein
MQVVLPDVMRYSEPVAGAHLSGPAEVPSATFDKIRYAQRADSFREDFYSKHQRSSVAFSARSGHSKRPSISPRQQLYFGCAHSTSIARKSHDSNHRRSN